MPTDTETRNDQELHPADEDRAGLEITTLPSDPMVDVQVATAKRFPRSISRFRKEAEAMAVLDEETAGECFYVLPRGGKRIEGPSARLAEILVYAWGNARADAEVIDVGDTHLVAQGTFFDLERNIAIRKKVHRRITDKHGRRYNDDMIGVTGNAASSIALRNVVFAGIPKALWKGIYLKARRASIGEGGTLTQKRQASLEWFGKLGVEEARVFDLLGVDGIEDIKEDELITLRGLANAIKDGEVTVEETFARPGSLDDGGAEDLNEQIKRKTAEAKKRVAKEKKAEAEPACACGVPLAEHREMDECAGDPDHPELSLAEIEELSGDLSKLAE